MGIPGHEQSRGVPADLIRTVARHDLPLDLVARLERFPDLTPALSDALDQLDVDGQVLPAAAAVRPVTGSGRLIGPATTLRYVPVEEDSSTLRRSGQSARLGDKDAVAHARRGDVLVVDAGGNTIDAVLGDRTAARLSEGGMVGAVINGAIRDARSIDATGFPVWAAGCTPRNALHRLETAEINGPIDLAGIHVAPGDLIAADENGLVVVPHGLIEEVLVRAEEIEGLGNAPLQGPHTRNTIHHARSN